MYGVIIKESKGNFRPFIFSHFPETKLEYLNELYYNQASIGLIESDEFFTRIGFTDPISAKKDYIENYLTLDDEFIRFAEQYKSQFRFAILSNDVLAWNEYILKYYDIDKYFSLYNGCHHNSGYLLASVIIFTSYCIERGTFWRSDRNF